MKRAKDQKYLRYFIVYTNHKTLEFSWCENIAEYEKVIADSKSSNYSIQVFGPINIRDLLIYRTISEKAPIFHIKQ